MTALSLTDKTVNQKTTNHEIQKQRKPKTTNHEIQKHKKN